LTPQHHSSGDAGLYVFVGHCRAGDQAALSYPRSMRSTRLLSPMIAALAMRLNSVSVIGIALRLR
jgi:cation transport ATPase